MTDFSEAEIDVIQNGEYMVLARNCDTIRAPDIAGYLFSKNMYSYPIVHVDCSAQYCWNHEKQHSAEEEDMVQPKPRWSIQSDRQHLSILLVAAEACEQPVAVPSQQPVAPANPAAALPATGRVSAVGRQEWTQG